ncbi:TRAP transporter small permease [Fontivita pretiosa]|uniref:TRAP transporter small permease n=1 Tax=Fontivita pretiosa TaxID=2989684 RepID=UPI003D172F77
MSVRPTSFRLIEAPTRLLEWLCTALMFVLILDVLWGVVSRFISPIVGIPPSRWTDEVATFLLIWVAMLGAALAHRQAAHLGVNWLVERLDPHVGRAVGRFAHVMIILFAAIVMVYGGIVLVRDRFNSGQVLPALGWSKAWVYLAVPVAGLFIVGYSLRELIWPGPTAPATPGASQQQPTPTTPTSGDII